MKNKKFLVIIATALMACLVVGMGAMTYSRYITTGNTGEQSATAAQWGFVVTVNANNLFSSDYKSNGTGVSATSDGSGAVVVDGTGDAKVVAPGTKGEMKITISGKAEVRAKLTIEQVAGTTLKEIFYDSYYPVVWTLKEGESVIKTGKLSEVIDELTGTTDTLEPGTTYTKSYTLSWEWAFEAGADDATKLQNNVKDTLIGNKAVGTDWAKLNGTYIKTHQLGATEGAIYTAVDGINTTMAFSLSVSVEQVQA